MVAIKYFIKPQTIYEDFQCISYCAKHFLYIVLFNPHKSLNYHHSIGVETEASGPVSREILQN